jgi:hypothetical protein
LSQDGADLRDFARLTGQAARRATVGVTAGMLVYGSYHKATNPLRSPLGGFFCFLAVL